MPNHYQDPTSNPTRDDARIGDYPMVPVGDIMAVDVKAYFPDRMNADPYALRPVEAITHLVIHHDGLKYAEVGPLADLDRIANVYTAHRQNGWPGIGYHFMVSPTTGNLYLTGAANTTRYHATQMNPHSLGLCVMGDWSANTPYTKELEQLTFQRLKTVVDNIQKALGKRLITIGHKEIGEPVCPGAWWGPEVSNWFNTLPNSLPLNAPALMVESLPSLPEVLIGVPREDGIGEITRAQPLQGPLLLTLPGDLSAQKEAILEKLQEVAVMVARLGG